MDAVFQSEMYVYSLNREANGITWVVGNQVNVTHPQDESSPPSVSVCGGYRMGLTARLNKLQILTFLHNPFR